MKAHKITVLVIDFDGMHEHGDIAYEIERSKHLNVKVKEIETVDIGEWDDDHPLNKRGADWQSYFKKGSDEA